MKYLYCILASVLCVLYHQTSVQAFVLNPTENCTKLGNDKLCCEAPGCQWINCTEETKCAYGNLTGREWGETCLEATDQCVRVEHEAEEQGTGSHQEEATNTTTAQPNITTTQPNATTTQPNATTAQPNATTAQPNITTAQPNITTAQPNITTAQPNVTTAQPNATTAQPNTTTAQPNITTAQPNITTAHPNATTAQPMTTTPTVSPNTTVITGSTMFPPTTAAGKHGTVFDAASFLGGIVLAAGVLAIIFFSCKFYKTRQENKYSQM